MVLGRVYIVGAGPGDPGLITIKALNVLKKADLVVYDRLIGDGILKLIPKEIQKQYVGKVPGCNSIKQEEINNILITEALKGKIVVRLKGGDPFLFGRGGEEAIILKKANIPFEIIPGVSSFLAAPLYAGIPLTHRKYSSSLAIVTGHEDPTKIIKRVKWEKIATSVDTILIVMGVKRLNEIVKELLIGGINPETMVAIIENGTKPNQRVTMGKIKEINKLAEDNSVKPPAIIIIGDITNLQEELSWFRG